MWLTRKLFVFPLLFWFAHNLLLLVHAQDNPSGFISIDCGKSGSSYTEKVTGITYISDSNFVDTGESNFILDKYLDVYQQPYQSLRSFPQGIRNCYKINITSGTRYLIRAIFVHGNYGGLDKLPKFDLYLGPNLWDSVELTNASIAVTKELIHYVPRPRNYIQLCLVNKLSGVPFISAIELRPLPNSTYSDQEGSLALVSRFDTGQIAPNFAAYRYPFDVLDRFWYVFNDFDYWTQLNSSTNSDVSTTMPSESDQTIQLPFVVMSTASTPKNANGSLNNFWPPEADDKNADYYIYMHFAEVERLQPNQSRQFNITVNGEHFYGPFAPTYFKTSTIYNPKALKGGLNNVTISRTENSSFPPILNAYEIYVLKEFSESETSQEDVGAVTNIKSRYKIKRNWQGDPCTPTRYSWEGLNCSYHGADESPRITSLYLARSGLQGEIDPYISKLAMLQTLDLSNNNLTGPIPEFLSQLPNLVHLDLSSNNLTGQIPDIFSQLPKLTFLNLERNKLMGSIPERLIQRKNNGFLTLRLCENPNLRGTVSCNKKKKQNVLLLLAISIVGVSILVVIYAAIRWSFIRKRQHDAKANIQLGSVESAKRKFAHSEIVKMTNNFQRILGKGGFGTVYHGHIDNTQVAIKMLSPSSVQGFQQFHAEVDLLIRVHHKNLTSLVGYCNDETNLGLVYEFMANGNLQEQLSDSSSRILSWEDRLRIAVDAAQGLEYLHYGIKPPIIHRDVKPANILLDDNFEAKVSDFGLSSPADAGTHISTGVAGTTGYLDPEYYLSNRLNEKSDVYSFGIVLLEIITGRPAVLSTTDERIHISQWVGFMLVRGDISSIIDPRLDGDFTVNSVWKAVEIAMACASPNAIKRPTMSQVVMELKECMATQMGETNHNNKTKLTISTELMSNDSIPMLSPPSVR